MNNLTRLYTQDQVVGLLNQLNLNDQQVAQGQHWVDTEPSKDYFADESLIAIGNHTRDEFILLLKKLLHSDQLDTILDIDKKQIYVYKSEITYLLHMYLKAQIENKRGE